ncbi:DUF3696 domain-containing protein [Pontibacter arcticus]|uniref:DUF3696 domain-containing protein n=1 Tax=Pontibacter arcticus TaxID=2080288 RepID=A0A364RET1_9BACT|nr:DUF3696 domain-containing protein [Pontibacter arcticus]RAU82784.1 hypothetical protein DP923_05900 [Pontibacter arcticus]
MVTRISFKNYKSFKERQEISLRPITILIGKNSSGKSAVSKLLTLIEGSLSGDYEQPIRWENKGVKLGSSNSDLVYNRNVTTSILDFELSSKKEKLAVTVAVDRKDRASLLAWAYNNKSYECADIKFKGFLNDQVHFKDLSLNVDYIGPIRELPKPNYTNTFETINTIGITGSNAYPILIQDSENSGELIKQVSEWYRMNFEGWKVEVLPITAPVPTFQIVLSNKNIIHINITNVGQGMNQALPLIVRSFMADEKDVRIIIEEPETHLHPAAHGNLAERFVDSYLNDNKKQYFIETHSQNFVLRMRRLVAQNKLNVNDLAIYYVDFDEEKNESIINPIKVYPDGNVEWWPDGIFSEALNETRAIRNAQIQNPIKN